jgi:hypothetical protein
MDSKGNPFHLRSRPLSSLFLEHVSVSLWFPNRAADLLTFWQLLLMEASHDEEASRRGSTDPLEERIEVESLIFYNIN